MTVLPYLDMSRSPAERTNDLLSRMSLEEKVGQLSQRLYGFHCYAHEDNQITLTPHFCQEAERYGSIGSIYGVYRADPWSGKDHDNGLTGTSAIRTRNEMQRYLLDHSRLKLPAFFATECPHGHQALHGYLLPVNLASAATFNPKLVKQGFTICGQQMYDMGIHLAYCSVLDMLRDPRWGRCEETFGEDPFLASRMAEAVVQAITLQRVGVVAKHFCAQGETTGGINGSAANIGMRELQEIHLPPAKAAVRAGVVSMMATYNEIDGIPMTGNSRLINGILRRDMGFTGFVMSDALAIGTLDQITGDPVSSAIMALKSGVDMTLLDDAFGCLTDAVRKGQIEESLIDNAVKRVLHAKFASGLFDHPFIKENIHWMNYTYEKYPESEIIAEESMTLLKNEGALLPLHAASLTSIGLVGHHLDNLYSQCGDYTPCLTAEEGVTFLQGLEDYLHQHAPQCHIHACPLPDLFSTSESIYPAVLQRLETCGTVILLLGGSSDRFGSTINANGSVNSNEAPHMDCGEGVDTGTLELPGCQLELLQKLKSQGKRIITILVGGRPYAMNDIVQHSDAILYCFYPGPMGGKVLPRLLLGDASPSGRLPVSLPLHVGQLPVYYNHKHSYTPMKHYDLPHTPAFPFGFGLTYTSFSFTLLDAPTGTKPQLSLRIKNTGTHPAHAIPQLYLLRKTGIATARMQLCAFSKSFFQPGEEKNIILSITPESFEQCDEDGHLHFVSGSFQWFLKDMGKTWFEGSFTISEGE